MSRINKLQENYHTDTEVSYINQLIGDEVNKQVSAYEY